MRHCLLFFLGFLLSVACDDVTFSPLVGKWQLRTVEKFGVIIPVDTVWYNFQSLSIFSMQVNITRDSFMAFPGMRTQDDKTISIIITENQAFISRYSDWSSDRRSFTLVSLSRRRLVLQSEEGYNYSFNKF